MLGALLGARAARADDLDEGIKAYSDLDFETAAAKLESALDAPKSEPPKVARAALYLGLVRFQLGDEKGAITYFSAALAYDDSLELPKDTSPKIRKVFAEVEKNLDFPRPRLKADPPDRPVVDKQKRREPAPPPAPARPARGSRGRLWTWISAATTLAAAGTGVAFAFWAKSARDEIERAPHERPELDTLRSQLRLRAHTANVLFAVTGALAVSSVFVYLAEGRASRRAETPAVAVGAGAGGAYVGARFSF